MSEASTYKQSNEGQHKKQFPDVPGVPKNILELFSSESKMGYALFEKILAVDEYQHPANRREQLRVIASLSKEIIEGLRQHLISSEQRESYFQGKKTVLTEKKKKMILSGEIFEELVRTEFKLQESTKNTKEQFRKKNQITKEFLDVWQYPEKYSLDTHWRNPDAAFFEMEDDGTITLQAVGEVKSGKLNARSYEQLVREGIQNQLIELVHVLKKKDTAWFLENKLPMLAKVCANLRIADNFTIRLVVPRNRAVSEEGITYTEAEALIQKDTNNPSEVSGQSFDKPSVSVSAFVEELVSSGRIDVQKSLFSQRELWALRDYFYDEIQKLS